MAEIPGAVSFGPGESAGVVGSGPGGASASGAAPGATPSRLAVLGNPIARRDRPGAAAVAAVASASVSAPAASGPPPPPWTRSLDDGRMAILRFLQGLKGRSRGGNVSVQDLAAREQEVRAFLWHLDAFGDPTPELRAYPQRIDHALNMFSLSVYRECVPADITQWAKAIYDRFTSANWGVGVGISNSSSGSGNDNTATTISNAVSAALPPAAAAAAAPALAAAPNPNPAPNPSQPPRLPPPNHPIWGLNGILHGLYMRPTTPNHSRSYGIDPRYAAQKQPSNVFGHNGLTPGDWWPLQLAAVYNGAHGNAYKGIFGSPTHGAYSIVISGRSTPYQDLNQDRGTTLWYSADRPTRAAPRDGITNPSADTHALQQSERTGRPVRVLRSAGPQNLTWAPSVGIRYEGLYRVVESRDASNGAGGRVWKFLLVRVRGQMPDLQSIVGSVPSARQVREEGRVRFGY